MATNQSDLPGKLKESLMADEQILWKGGCEPFPLVTPLNKKSLLVRWVLCAALFVILSVAYVLLSLRTAGFSIVVELVLLVIFAYVAGVPLLDHNKLVKKCGYYVTDKRIISAVGYSEVFPISRAGLKLRAVPAENGCVHLLFGAATELPEKKLPLNAIAPIKSEKGEGVVGLVFFNVKDTPALHELLNY